MHSAYNESTVKMQSPPMSRRGKTLILSAVYRTFTINLNKNTMRVCSPFPAIYERFAFLRKYTKMINVFAKILANIFILLFFIL